MDLPLFNCAVQINFMYLQSQNDTLSLQNIHTIYNTFYTSHQTTCTGRWYKYKVTNSELHFNREAMNTTTSKNTHLNRIFAQRPKTSFYRSGGPLGSKSLRRKWSVRAGRARVIQVPSGGTQIHTVPFKQRNTMLWPQQHVPSIDLLHLSFDLFTFPHLRSSLHSSRIASSFPAILVTMPTL